MPFARLSDGRRLFYEREGDGDGAALLLLHGIGSSSASFRHQLAGLGRPAGLASAVAWDAPGYGKSDDPAAAFTLESAADDAVGLLDALGLARADVLGHSMGGVIAQLVYHRHPTRVRSLILSDTVPGTGSLGAAERAARVRARLDAIDTLTPRELAARRAPQTVSAGAPPDLIREIEDVMAEIRPATYRAAAIALGDTDLTRLLSTIRVSVLVVCGELDTTVTPSACRAMAAAIPNATYVEIPAAGHASNQEQPATYNAAVRAFLGERPPRTA